MRLAIVIGSIGKASGDPRRVRAAYLHESPRTAQIVVAHGHSLPEAWESGLALVDDDMDWIHFGADWLEPHPGWWKAARADSQQIASPVLWQADGTPPAETRDWTPATGSEFPTMTRRQIDRLGLPPLGTSSGAEFVVRTQYAFTVL